MRPRRNGRGVHPLVRGNNDLAAINCFSVAFVPEYASRTGFHEDQGGGTDVR